MLSLSDCDVHVWYVFPQQACADGGMERYEALLSPEERARNGRFVFDADRRRDLVARALVRTTLSRYADVEPRQWVFSTGPFGRPEIAGPSGAPRLRFSLAHTSGLVALAVTPSSDIGLDAERLDTRVVDLDVAERFFAPSEAASLAAMPAARRQRAFLEYWTLKEAYVKATGEGLSLPLDSFAIQLADPPQLTFADGSPAACEWQLSRLTISPDHVAALAVRHRRPLVSIRHTIPLSTTSTG